MARHQGGGPAEGVGRGTLQGPEHPGKASLLLPLDARTAQSAVSLGLHLPALQATPIPHYEHTLITADN